VSWTRVAAAACLLPLAFYSFWIPTQTNALQSGLFTTSDFNPLHQQNAPAYQKSKLTAASSKEVTAPSLDFEQQNSARLETYEWQPGFNFIVQVPAAPVVQTQAPVNPVASSAEAKYDFIVGCFSNLQNAQNLQRKLQRDGFAARLIQNGPLTKVSAGAAQNLSELQQIQQQATSRGLQGWVLNN
jgi:cell division septation protein DedD